MAQDFAKKKAAGKPRKKTASKKPMQSKPASPWRWYGAGVMTGVLLSFLLYLGTLPSNDNALAGADTAESPELPEEAPKPRFDFYTLLPERTMTIDADPSEEPVQPGQPMAQEYFLLQAGSFKQLEDADRRRAELLLLGLEPLVEESDGDNGRWFRVFLGPFESKSKMAKARSLTANQDIDTLLLKRTKP